MSVPGRRRGVAGVRSSSSTVAQYLPGWIPWAISIDERRRYEDNELLIVLEETMGKDLQSYLAFAFGCIFIAALLVLAVVFPNPSKAQYEIFRIVIAIAAGGVGAVIPGLLSIKMNLAMTANQRVLVQAGGALAMFVIVYFF